MSEIRDRAREKVGELTELLCFDDEFSLYDLYVQAQILSIPELAESIKAYESGYRAGIQAVQNNPDVWSGIG